MLITAADIWPGPAGAKQAALGAGQVWPEGSISGSQPEGPMDQETTVSQSQPVLRLAMPEESWREERWVQRGSRWRARKSGFMRVGSGQREVPRGKQRDKSGAGLVSCRPTVRLRDT